MVVDSTQSLQAANVTGAIRKAARITGTNFQYLLATAKVESNLNPEAAAKTSSAGGLFQFVEQTWLQTLKESGEAFGYGQYADAIAQDASGRFVVPDPAMRSEILDLRRDPTANALMAGAFTQSNAAFLKERLGRAPSEGELYIAHFMGASGAARLIGQAGENPDALAADAFPNAARANRSFFFDKSGRARDFGEVAAALSGKFDGARANAAPAATVPVVAPVVTAQATRAYEAASPLAIAQRAAAANGEPLYSNPYRATARPAATAPVATAAADPWAQAAANAARGRQMAANSAVLPQTQTAAATQPSPAREKAAAIAQAPKLAAGELLNLFRDSKADVRALFGTGGPIRGS
jgi:hypothetical protein